MKKAISLILIAGVVLGMFALAACGNNMEEDMTSMMDDATTLMDEMSEDLSEALTDEGTTEEESTEETTEVTTDVTTDIAVTDNTTKSGDETTISGGTATE